MEAHCRQFGEVCLLLLQTSIENNVSFYFSFAQEIKLRRNGRIKMSVCALVGALGINKEHFKNNKFDYIIAVDRGFERLEAIGVTPNLVIGDFDSLGYIPKHPFVQRYSTQKDESDIEIALHEAVDRGFDALIIYGCLGGRLDFTYAVYQLLGNFAEAGKKIFAIGDNTVVGALNGAHHSEITFGPQAEGLFSLFAFSERVMGVKETGLEYSVNNIILHNNKPLGVSNNFIGEPSLITIAEGTALFFFSSKSWSALQMF